MKTRISNGFISKYQEDMDILSFDHKYFDKILDSFKIKRNQDKLVNHQIAWNEMLSSYSFMFDFEGSEKIITEQFRMSALSKYDYLIIEMGYEEPVIRVKTKTYIENWSDFFAASGYMGITGITEDGKLFFELTDRDFQMKSNFKI